MRRNIQADTLFVGLTRPATIFGIPYMAFVIEFMGVSVVFLAMGNPFYLLLGVPVHGLLYLMSAHDPGRFETLAIWLKTSGRCRTTGFWGAVSFSPAPAQKNRARSGLAFRRT